MSNKQQSFIYKFVAIVFALLLLTPCTIKADIKVSLNIATADANKDRLAVSTCSAFSTFSATKSKAQVASDNITFPNHSQKLLEKESDDLLCFKTQELENKKVAGKVYFQNTPIFIHFQQLVI